MNTIRKLALTVVILLSGICVTGAETKSSTPIFKPSHEKQTSLKTEADTFRNMQFKIAYRINKFNVDSTYMGNAENLQTIRTYLKESTRIDSIVIYSFASPEGPYYLNRYLSRNRGIMAKKFIMGSAPENRPLSEDMIKIKSTAENWEGLKHEILTNYNRDDREEVLKVLYSDLSSDAKKRRLRNMPSRPWRFIIDSIMPNLRYAQWICTWGPRFDAIDLESEIAYLPFEPAKYTYRAPIKFAPKPIEYRKTIFALKSNLLYDAISWANASLEVPFCGNKFSMTYDHQFPWWRWSDGGNKFCMRYLQIGGEFRWWFKPRTKPATKHRVVRDKLAGHFLGVYGMGGKWDFERARSICYQGEFWSTGLSYGYSLPISKRLNLEFTASVGYANIPYRHFIPSGDYEILFRDPTDTGTWNYVGITKLGVTLVIPITIKKTIMPKEGGWR